MQILFILLVVCEGWWYAMSGAWDSVIKQLLEKNTQQFVAWLVEDGQFVETLSVELKRRDIYADALYKVSLYDRSMLLHIELQSKAHPYMAERLLEYSVQASRLHDYLPVLSTVIYLVKDTNIPDPPLVSTLPDGRKVLQFAYTSIKLWEIESRTILDTHLPGLLPLLTLTKDGQSMDVVDIMIERIGSTSNNKESFAFAYTIAGLIFKGEENQQALKRRFAMLDEILQDSWVYQEIQQKGVEIGEEKGLRKGVEIGEEKGLRKGVEIGEEKGLRKGVEEGLKKGIEQGLEQTNQKWLASQRAFLLDAVESSFPTLLPFATERSQQVYDPEVLLQASARVFKAQTQAEAQNILADLPAATES